VARSPKQPPLTVVKSGPVEPDKPNISIRSRVFNQVGALLTQLEEGEHVTMRERVQALIAISRIEQIYFMLKLKEQPENEQSGSTVRKYATAFSKDAVSGRAANRRTEPEPDDWFEHAERDDPDDDTA
jgi:hypothetical protein